MKIKLVGIIEETKVHPFLFDTMIEAYTHAIDEILKVHNNLKFFCVTYHVILHILCREENVLNWKTLQK